MSVSMLSYIIIGLLVSKDSHAFFHTILQSAHEVGKTGIIISDILQMSSLRLKKAKCLF